MECNTEITIMPTSRACSICKNNMNDICLEGCTHEGKYKFFDPAINKHLNQLPKLTLSEYRELPGRMKGEWLFIQQKILDFHGNRLERHINYPRSRRLLKVIKKQSLQDGSERGHPIIHLTKRIKVKTN